MSKTIKNILAQFNRKNKGGSWGRQSLTPQPVYQISAAQPLSVSQIIERNMKAGRLVIDRWPA